MAGSTLNQNVVDRALALAGIFQAAHLVQQLARDGRTDPEAFKHSVNSILVTDAEKTEDIYGSLAGVKTGLTLLRDKLSGEAEPLDMELAKYVIAMIQHANRLSNRPELLDAISQGIDTIGEQMKFFEAGEPVQNGIHPNLIEKLAELYSQTISTLVPRIIINGEHGYLSNPAIAAKVRATLFSGIRAAYLWRQLGGRRWHLLFNRRRTIDTASDILEHIRETSPPMLH